MKTFLLLFVAISSPAFAESPADQVAELRHEIDSLKQGQKEIQKTLSAVRDILTGKRPPIEDVFVGVEGSPAFGDKTAKVTIVEFTDYQCPFCGAYARDTFGRITAEYVKTGRVRYVSRNFPLDGHPFARKAAEAAMCANEQGKYWELHDRFFSDQTKLSIDDFPGHAAAVGADAAELVACVESGKYAQRVAADMSDGRDLGVAGTPTFFVGYGDGKNPARMRAVRSIVGNGPYREFQKAIDDALEAQSEEENK